MLYSILECVLLSIEQVFYFFCENLRISLNKSHKICPSRTNCAFSPKIMKIVSDNVANGYNFANAIQKPIPTNYFL